MKKRVSPRTVAYAACAIFALTTPAFAQNSGPTVEVRHDSKDSKAVPITEEKEPSVHFLLEAGYTSEYNFRGTNLMPGCGGYFYSAQATIPKVGPGSLTVGMWAIHQIGTAAAKAWSISEGGGGGGAAGSVGNGFGGPGTSVNFARFPTTVQTQFREFDLFAAYKISLGPVDVTLGNIIFVIDREAQTFEDWVITSPGFVWTVTGTTNLPMMPEKTVTGELFDRVYIRLSTSKIPHITPSIVYYQTVVNEGDEPTAPRITLSDATGQFTFTTPGPLGERNTELGGYLEARLNGNFACGHWLDINPYGVIGYSFRDRTEPVMGSFGGRPLTGFSHTQAGLEFAFHITPHIDIVPQAVYSYHMSTPPIGTDRNEVFGGVKVAVNLW